MKSSLAGVAVLLTVAIAGCDQPAAIPEADARAEVPAVTTPPALPVAVATPGTTESPSVAASAVPRFAVVYPNAEVEGDPLLAGGAAGPGGMVTFVTDAEPETVIAFYRERAEAEGLATMMSLNQGAARAYGAQNQATGANLNVVAAPSEAKTSVQLTWSAGL